MLTTQTPPTNHTETINEYLKRHELGEWNITDLFKTHYLDLSTMNPLVQLSCLGWTVFMENNQELRSLRMEREWEIRDFQTGQGIINLHATLELIKDSSVAKSNIIYDMGIIEIPHLSIRSFWLNTTAEEDIFIIAPICFPPAKANKFYTPTEFMEIIMLLNDKKKSS